MHKEEPNIGSDLLFRRMLESFSKETYPQGLESVPSLMDGLSFFPAGRGLYQPNGSMHTPVFPHEGVMVVGRDFGTRVAYDLAHCEHGERESDPTWKHLLKFLEDAGCDPRSCFFSNAFMGLRSGQEARNIGDIPAHRDANFLAACRDFFVTQIEMMHPRILLTLGSAVPAFVAMKLKVDPSWCAGTLKAIDEASASVQKDVAVPDLGFTIAAVVALTHPCLRPANVRRRSYKKGLLRLRGQDAEEAMLGDALAHARFLSMKPENPHAL